MFITILAFLVSGILGAALGGAGSFITLFGLCRVMAWLLGNPNLMWLMMSGMVICPAFAVGGFVAGGGVGVQVLAIWGFKEQRRGFEIVMKTDHRAPSSSGGAENSSSSQS
jgi:hypothetical protein